MPSLAPVAWQSRDANANAFLPVHAPCSGDGVHTQVVSGAALRPIVTVPSGARHACADDDDCDDLTACGGAGGGAFVFIDVPALPARQFSFRVLLTDASNNCVSRDALQNGVRNRVRLGAAATQVRVDLFARTGQQRPAAVFVVGATVAARANDCLTVTVPSTCPLREVQLRNNGPCPVATATAACLRTLVQLPARCRAPEPCARVKSKHSKHGKKQQHHKPDEQHKPAASCDKKSKQHSCTQCGKPRRPPTRPVCGTDSACFAQDDLV